MSGDLGIPLVVDDTYGFPMIEMEGITSETDEEGNTRLVVEDNPNL